MASYLFNLPNTFRAPGNAGTGGSILERTALETDFPAVELSRAAQQESWRKEVHRPATYTHKWWARRLGSIFRGILAASITGSGEETLKVFNCGVDLDKLTVFDPFAGSGTTLVEAAKLGAEALGWDLNPVAALVQRQALQRWDWNEILRAYKAVETACREEIDRVHRTRTGEDVLYYFWVATVPCPVCAQSVRLFSNHVFSQHAYPRRRPEAQIVCPACFAIVSGRFDFERLRCPNGHTVTRQGAVSRVSMQCPIGHVSPVLDAVGQVPPGREMFAKLVLNQAGHKRYEAVDDYDRELYEECSRLLSERETELILPTGSLEAGYNTRQAIRWGFREWRQFFNDRQLYSLGLLGRALADLECGSAEREALITLFSGSLEFNNMFCSFKGEGTGAVRHMFSHHILKPERVPLEAHPWGTVASSGSFSTLFASRLERAHQYKTRPTDLVILGNGEVKKTDRISPGVNRSLVERWQPSAARQEPVASVRYGDAAHTDLPTGSVDLVLTDPPYMDNVHYSELADFFHAWLKHLRPFTSYAVDCESTRSSAEVQSESADDFQRTITAVWKECRRVLKPEGLLAFTFHQARMNGWRALVQSLADAEFVVTAVQPVKGEMSVSVTKSSAGEPSNLDSIVVCRPAEVGRDVAFDVEAAVTLGVQRLVKLRSGAIDIGLGDLRSVIRGHILSLYTHRACPWGLDVLASKADDAVATARQLLEVDG